jgi:hypothetical protein
MSRRICVLTAVLVVVLVLPAAASAADPLQITTAANRTGYSDLEGYRVASDTTQVCVTLSNSPTKTGPVVFSLDGTRTRQENIVPWDYFGTDDSTGGCYRGTFARGTHTMRATWTGGEDSSSFAVGPAPDTSIASVADADSPTFVDEDGNGSEQVNVGFSGTNSPKRYECSVSGATTVAFTACTAPWSVNVNVGSNTVSVRACDAAGCDATPASNTFTMQAGAAAPPPPPPGADPLQVTTATNRSGSQDLEGYTVASSSTGVCVTLSNTPAKTGPVVYNLEGVSFHTENSAPWDYFGTNDGTGGCYQGTFTRGSHTIRATWSGGQDSSTFSVAGTAGGGSAGGYSSTQPAGFMPLSDAQAAALVTRKTWEPRSDNATANAYVPSDSALASFHANSGQQPLASYVTGRDGISAPVTDELIQWAAWKWGIDEDTIRAVAVNESDWHQSMLGDYRGGPIPETGCSASSCPTSFGITQIKDQWHDSGHGGTYPLSRTSTAFNLDYYGRWLRSCMNGLETWLTRTTGDLWGCVGAWFSGSWHSGSDSYVASARNALANKTWLSY